MSSVTLHFDAGTLLVTGAGPEELPAAVQRFVKFDSRTHALRARACDYAELFLTLQLARIQIRDEARNFAPVNDLTLAVPITPRPHQTEALAAWRRNGYRGVAALPTGSGKTILAVLAIAALKRPAIVLAPTIDLVAQWAETLQKFFGRSVGMLGGGSHDVREITVSTYESAVLQMEFIGNRFALLVADECHHLPGPEIRLGAAMCIAPYRLGLSATPELPEDRAAILRDLIGPTVCEVNIDELEGTTLSRYRLHTVPVKLDPEEADAYRAARETYTAFLQANRITFRTQADWGRFLGLCARSERGKAAFQAFLEQRRIARGGEAKLRVVWELLRRHRGERSIIFTADNAVAYEIGRRYGLPTLTCRTKAAERKRFLELFRTGEYTTLVTSRVLNEGIDVPAAAIGIILSGSGSVREHVQRLGRILRPAPGKVEAELYELVSAGTSEERISARRREHRAYKGHC